MTPTAHLVDKSPARIAQIERDREAAKTRYDLQRKKRHESWELERIADKVLRESELRGYALVTLTAGEASALLSWIRRAEQAA